MSPLPVASPNPHERAPGANPSALDAPAQPSSFTSPLVDPPGHAIVAERRFRPSRVTAGPMAPQRPPEPEKPLAHEAPSVPQDTAAHGVCEIEPLPSPVEEPLSPDSLMAPSLVFVGDEALNPDPIAPELSTPGPALPSQSSPALDSDSPERALPTGESAADPERSLAPAELKAPPAATSASDGAPPPGAKTGESSSAPAPSGAKDAKVASDRKPQNGAKSKPQSKPESPKTKPQKPISSQGARNAALGLGLAYVDRASAQIGGPISFLLSNFIPLLMGLAHLAIPLALAMAIATLNPAMRATFLEGGSIANAGKLIWLYVICAFLWSLAYMGIARLARALRGDLSRFERIGRSALTQNSKER